MKLFVYGLAGLLISGLFACRAQPKSATALGQTDGVLLASVYSRGAYQYILAVPNATATTRLYPINLADSLKQQLRQRGLDKSLPVRFSGELTGRQEILLRISADDRGEKAGDIPQINLTAITVRQ